MKKHLVLLSLFLSAPSLFALSGTVTDTGGAPLVGCKVTLQQSGATATTSAAGKFNLGVAVKSSSAVSPATLSFVAGQRIGLALASPLPVTMEVFDLKGTRLPQSFTNRMFSGNVLLSPFGGTRTVGAVYVVVVRAGEHKAVSRMVNTHSTGRHAAGAASRFSAPARAALAKHAAPAAVDSLVIRCPEWSNHTAPVTAGGDQGTVVVPAKRPNIILMMADDLGWGDVGFNGNTIIETPNLDKYAADGIRFTRFHSGSSVCSPTRASCLTGRHPYRHGIWTANTGALSRHEVTLSAELRKKGYFTGHFGKWHIGSPNPKYTAKGRGHASYPEWFGYDDYFVVHHAIHLWNPFGANGVTNRFSGSNGPNPFWEKDTTDTTFTKPGLKVTAPLIGDASRIVMDRALPFIKKAEARNQPFFMVLWWNAPHSPVDAGPEHQAIYANKGITDEGKKKYYGCITAMDDQVGRLRDTLKSMGMDKNTMIWFCSDNGPEGKSPSGSYQGVTGDQRGRKRSLFAGGVCVPAFLYWPGYAVPGRVDSQVVSTVDYLPTIFDWLKISMPDNRPVDGESMMPLITAASGDASLRSKMLPFRYHTSKSSMFESPTASIIKGRYKFLSNLSLDYKPALKGSEEMLFDLYADRGEQTNLIATDAGRAAHAALINEMRDSLRTFLKSAEESYKGKDYPAGTSFTPHGTWKKMTGTWP